MQLNLALFEFNGRTGYLLKHDVLRRGDKKFDPFCDRIDTVVASTLTIKARSYPSLTLILCQISNFFLLQVQNACKTAAQLKKLEMNQLDRHVVHFFVFFYMNASNINFKVRWNRITVIEKTIFMKSQKIWCNVSSEQWFWSCKTEGNQKIIPLWHHKVINAFRQAWER